MIPPGSLLRANPVRPNPSGMRTDHSARRASMAGSRPDAHDDFREGARLGLAVGATTWLWIALVDAIAGQPFFTFDLFGGVAPFTAVHALLNVVYGVAIVSAIHGAARVPSMIYAVGFGVLFLEIAFAFATVVLSSLGLGDLAWIRIFGASVLGATMALTLAARRHPLAELLRQADEET